MGSKTKKTAAYIDALISEKGGYSKKALLELGVPWPPKKGWKRALIASSHAQAHGKSNKPVGASQNQSKKKQKKADNFYASWEWKKVRYESLKLHGRQCMCCGWSPTPGCKERLCVDHIKPRSKYPSLALDVSNTQVLCSSCNRGKSNVHEDDWRADWHGEEQDEEMNWMDQAFAATIQ